MVENIIYGWINIVSLFIAAFPQEFKDRENQFARIVKGFETKTSLPYQLKIMYHKKIGNETQCLGYCGGTLLTSKFVVTAQHCIPPGSEEILRTHFKVIAGSYHSLSS